MGNPLLFIFLAVIAIAAALGMLFSRNAIHSALFLVLNFATIAVFYIVLNAPFIAMVQVGERTGMLEVIAQSGGVVVAQESCTGIKPVAELVDQNGDPLEAIARKYFALPCSCMTPNNRRLGLLDEVDAGHRHTGLLGEVANDRVHLREFVLFDRLRLSGRQRHLGGEEVGEKVQPDGEDKADVEAAAAAEYGNTDPPHQRGHKRQQRNGLEVVGHTDRVPAGGKCFEGVGEREKSLVLDWACQSCVAYGAAR